MNVSHNFATGRRSSYRRFCEELTFFSFLIMSAVCLVRFFSLLVLRLLTRQLGRSILVTMFIQHKNDQKCFDHWRSHDQCTYLNIVKYSPKSLLHIVNLVQTLDLFSHPKIVLLSPIHITLFCFCCCFCFTLDIVVHGVLWSTRRYCPPHPYVILTGF